MKRRLRELRGGASADQHSKHSVESEDTIKSHAVVNKYIEFTAPQTVECKHEQIDVSSLEPDQILIKAVCSSISTGTEMKVGACYDFMRVVYI